MSRVYLLTGAAGFLGGEICRQLIDRHCTVRTFVLPNDPAAKYLPAGVEICKGDLCSASDVDFVSFEQTGVKIDMASAKSKTPKKLMEQLKFMI